ncbi:MAG TPA: TIGR00725 family protein [Dehalococcoidia bacterium]|nr:TIGR00725 family protein [Dehalococcoidia bacterium]
MAPYVAVVGPGEATARELDAAEQVGQSLAQTGAILVCGGLGGVMAAACRGARQAGGTTIGLLPGLDRGVANEWVQIAIPTGLGELRNGLIVRSADAVIAVGGAYGTLSEVALALKAGVPVFGLQSWEIDGIERTEEPCEAVQRAVAAGRRRTSS